MHDADETEEEETEERRDPVRWSWASFWSLFVACSAAHLTLWATFWSGVSDMMDENVKWKNGREEFHQRAALEIEALTRVSASVEEDRVS